MFRIEAGTTAPYCDGLSRRTFVQVGMAGLASTSLPRILQAKEAAIASGKAGRDTALILFWLDGGPSHLDTYDMKPEAPAEYRGIWRPIQTNTLGIELSPLFPMQSQIADKLAIVRSVRHPTTDHYAAAHVVLTGRRGVDVNNREPKSPAFTALAARAAGPRREGMLPYVSTPQPMTVGIRPGYFSGAYLGLESNPFDVGSDPNSPKFQIRNLALAPGMTVERLDDRRALRANIDQMRRAVDASGNADAMDRFERKAYELISGGAARGAFDLSREDAKLRDRYGRNSVGQSALLARRLVEAGSTVVTIHHGGWDHHWNTESLSKAQFPVYDRAIATLISDLSDRGMLDNTLVMACGEFSRTPRMNDGRKKGTPGRDHWCAAQFCVFAGGGVRGGQVIGSTSRNGETVHDRPVSIGDLHATAYRVLGVDSATTFANASGRPIPLLDEGKAIEELF